MTDKELINRKSLLERLHNICDANCPYMQEWGDITCRTCLLADAIIVVEDMESANDT